MSLPSDSENRLGPRRVTAWEQLDDYIDGAAELPTDVDQLVRSHPGSVWVARYLRYVMRTPRQRVVWTGTVDGTRARAAAIVAAHKSAETVPNGAHHRDVSSKALVTYRSFWAGTAAALAIFVVGLYVTTNTLQQTTHASAGEHIYTTHVGETALLNLSDGSQVTLAPRSILRVPKNFGRENRTVALNGEAYFSIDHAAGVPFVVQSNGVTTRVLGTAFIVRQYMRETRVRVSVLSGRVALTSRSANVPVLVTAGQTADASDSRGVRTLPNTNATDADWRRGRLVFNDTPTSEVLDALGQWYGYEFRLADTTLAAERWTGVLSTTSSSDALGTLKTNLEVDLTFDRNVVTLSRHRSVRPRTMTRDAAEQQVGSYRPQVGR